jgi:hypothetical protein
MYKGRCTCQACQSGHCAAGYTSGIYLTAVDTELSGSYIIPASNNS